MAVSWAEPAAVVVARVLRADRPARDREGMVRGAARFTCLASRGGWRDSQEVKLKEVPRNWFPHVKSDIKGIVPCGSGSLVVAMIKYRPDPSALASAERQNRKGNFGTTPTSGASSHLASNLSSSHYLLLSASLLVQIGTVLTDQ